MFFMRKDHRIAERRRGAARPRHANPHRHHSFVNGHRLQPSYPAGPGADRVRARLLLGRGA